MKNKKGVSEIVSTVLIVMIAVAAVGILGALVVPMIKDSLTGGQACFKALTDVSINQERTCYVKNATGDGYNVSVAIQKGSDQTVDLQRVDVLITLKDGNTNKTEKTGSLTLNSITMHTVTNLAQEPKEVAIAPVLKVGNKAKVCDISSRVVLTNCL